MLRKSTITWEPQPVRIVLMGLTEAEWEDLPRTSLTEALDYVSGHAEPLVTGARRLRCISDVTPWTPGRTWWRVGTKLEFL